jgi:hypothetical protein
LSATKRAAGTARANTDPDDPDAKGPEMMSHPYASTCIQPDHVRSQYVTAVYCKECEAAVCLGCTSFQRAETVFFVKPGPSYTTLMVSPVILYNGLQLDPGEELAIEEIGVYGDKSPLRALERYADRVREKKNLAPKPIDSIAGLWNYWLAFTEEENNAGAEFKAMEYQHANLLAYNIRSCPMGVAWHRDNAFFESRCKPHLGANIAEVAVRLAERFPDFHMCGGLFWGAASECSDFFGQHPEAILRDKEGNLCGRGSNSSDSWTRCHSPSYWVDFSHPAAKDFFKAHLQSLNEVDIRTFNFDFMGDHGEWKGVWGYLLEDDNPFLNCDPYDAHMNRPFETSRVVLEAVRETLGPGVVIRSYTALFMRYLGLIDVVRVAPDAGRAEYGDELLPVNWHSLRAILQNCAANYMFHGKWWWSDACGLCVGTRVVPERTEEFRIRSLIHFVVGGPMTCGDKVARMAPQQFRYYTINMPVTGHAARPLDLFDRELPEVYHFPKERTGFGHDLLTLLNLTDEPRDYELRLSDLGIDGASLAFEFWTKDMATIEDGALKVALPPLTGRHYALHQDRGTPLVVGTDFHLSMGAVEISNTQWNPEARTLSGTISRPDKESGHIYLWIPEGFDPHLARATGARIRSSDSVLALEVEASSDPVPWQVDLLP